VLLAVIRTPQPIAALSADAMKSVAAAAGLAAADVRMRLSGVLPRVLLSEREADNLDGAAAALGRLGFATVICDPAAAPTDDDRIIGRRVAVDGEVLQIWDGADTCHELPRPAIALVQRGLRTSTETTTTTTTQRKFDAGRALLSGGLMLTRKATQTTTQTTETRELFLLIQRRDGAPDVILYERRLDYRFLGAEMQPASRANFDRLLARLRAFCPRTPFDERAGQPGFLRALPSTSAEPTDLGLYLIALAHAQAAAATFSG
jgi:hypothetical protein